MRVIRVLAALWVAIVLQTTLAPAIAIAGVRPDLPLLIVVVVALRGGPAAGAIAGFAAGLFVDLNSTHVLGATSLANAALAWILGSWSDRLVRDSLVTRAGVAFVGTVLRDVALAVFLVPSGVAGAARHFFVAALPGGLYTAVLAIPFMAAAERIIGWRRESGRGLS